MAPVFSDLHRLEWCATCCRGPAQGPAPATTPAHAMPLGMDAMHRPVRDRVHTQPTFERAPGLLEALQLLVTQPQIGWAQVPIVMIQRVHVQRDAAIVTRSFRP